MSIAVATRLTRSAWPRLADFGPNWFASVMGTGIVATAAATLPFHMPGTDLVARGMWVLASALLVVVLAATALHWIWHPTVARGHLDHPVMAHFYGAPAMALMTVGAGAVLVGDDLIGSVAAITLATTLWTAGTTFGLWTAWAVPRLARRHGDRHGSPAFGGWLLPVVPPMVSAATGALLIPHLPAALRPTMIVGCYALFLVALAATLPIIVVIACRVASDNVGAAAAVPTLFIVLGPLGQSVTAAHTIGDEAGGPWDTIGFAYGAPILGVAMLWLLIATAILVRTARTGLPFGLAWWSFTFPLGTLVTGASGLAEHTGARALEGLAGTLFVALLLVWAIVAALTLRGVCRGQLLAAQTA